MPIGTHGPETDLLLPRPAAGEQWHPHTVHTYYFGFTVPEARIGVFAYLRCQPAFPLSQGGVCIFAGTDNVELTDIAFLDYEMTMPWPSVDGTTVTTDNGLRIEFLEPGRRARLTYAGDEDTRFDVIAEAVTPLFARGHVMPGEEDHHGGGRNPGGSEQFMHVTGELVLDGDRHAVDCHAPRDRSWNQIRVEKRGGAAPVPPIGWSPMHFGPDLIFNQVGFEPPDTKPAWTGLYDTGDRPSHHYAWVQRGDETRSITRVRRDVLEYHPGIHMAIRQEIEAEDDHGETYRFRGEAIAVASLPAWPNVSFHDSVYRWEDEAGRVTHSTYQEIWFDRYQKAMKRGGALR